MNRSKKSSIALAIVFICIGLTLILSSLILSSFDLSLVSSLQFTEVEHKVTLPFDSIHVEEIDCSVVLLPSEDGTCTVVSSEVPHLFNVVSVDDGTLTVRRRDERAWHERILVFGDADPTLTIYLPVKEYDALYLRTTAGDLRAQAPFSFCNATLKSVSGSILLSTAVKESISLSTTSGDISLEGQALTSVHATSTSGSITLRRVTAEELKLSSDSGKLRIEDNVSLGTLDAQTTSADVLLSGVTVKEALRVIGVSGNVALFDTEFADAYVETASGNVTGTLRSKKAFDVQTASGIVLHPECNEGGSLCIRTVSGNVSFSFLFDQE